MKYSCILFFAFLCACNQKHQSVPQTNITVADDTGFLYIIPDSTKHYWPRFFEHRYLARVRVATEALGLPVIEAGSDTTELRIWRLTSCYNMETQEIWRVQKIDTYYLIQHISFKLDPNKWDIGFRTREQTKGLQITEIRRDRIQQVPLSGIRELNIDSVWRYPSHSEIPRFPNNDDKDDCYRICIELADRKRFKFALYKSPSVLQDSAEVFRKITALHNTLSEMN